MLDDAVCALPLGVHAVGAARHFVERTLTAWGATSEEVGTGALLASELVTNAVLYGHGAATLRLQAAADRVRILVADGATAHPRARQVEADAEIGRGLQVVQACSLAWGVEPDGAGKVVWCDMHLRG